jgi:hypothetical protein
MPGYNHYPDCTCGWCHGGGGSGHRTPVAAAPLPAVGTRASWDCDDFCCPTKCPICGDAVFFVRHNGGSVWFDDLGRPWPKHACFDDGYYGARLRKTLREESRNTANPVFGVIIETEIIEPGKSGRIVVRCSDDTIINNIFDTEWNLTHYAGALVFIECPENGDTGLRAISTPLEYQWRPRSRLAEGARIILDRRKYIWDGRRWYGAEDNTIAPIGLQYRLNALAHERLRSTGDE